MRKFPAMPVLFKEFAVQMRGSRAALLIAVYVGLATIAARLIYGVIAGGLDRGAPLVSAQIGQVLFIGLCLGLQTLTVFLAPATTLNTISGEHERGTIGMLQMTPVDSFQLVSGKLVAGLAFLLLLVTAALPVFAVVALFGGVQPADLLRVMATLLVTALAGSIFGLFCSAVTRQTYSATLLCYAILVSLVGGTLFAASVWSLVNGMEPAPPAIVAANPLSAMASALVPTRPPELTFTGALRPLVLLNLLSIGLAEGGAAAGTLPLHRVTALIYGGISLVLFWLTVHLARPRRRWQLTKVDAAMLVLLLGYLVFVFALRAWWLPGLVGAATAA